MGRIDGKVALITGAAHGMGMAATKLFSKEGAKVVAIDFNKESLDKNIKSLGDENVLPLFFDVTDEAGWGGTVKWVVEKFGKIDILINNAGIQLGPEGILDTPIEHWNTVLTNDLTAIWLGMKAVIPIMQKNGGGSIVNTSSVAGLRGGIADGGSAAYSAAKGGVRSLTKHAANAFAKDNIRVNSVHPGTTNSALEGGAIGGIADAWSEEEIAAYSQALMAATPSPMVMAEPIDIAYCYLYLASDEARFVTGAEFVVDGGMTSH